MVIAILNYFFFFKYKGFRYSLVKRVSVKYDRMTIMCVKYGVLNHILRIPTYKINVPIGT